MLNCRTSLRIAWQHMKKSITSSSSSTSSSFLISPSCNQGLSSRFPPPGIVRASIPSRRSTLGNSRSLMIPSTSLTVSHTHYIYNIQHRCISRGINSRSSSGQPAHELIPGAVAMATLAMFVEIARARTKKKMRKKIPFFFISVIIMIIIMTWIEKKNTNGWRRRRGGGEEDKVEREK